MFVLLFSVAPIDINGPSLPPDMTNTNSPTGRRRILRIRSRIVETIPPLLASMLEDKFLPVEINLDIREIAGIWDFLTGDTATWNAIRSSSDIFVMLPVKYAIGSFFSKAS